MGSHNCIPNGLMSSKAPYVYKVLDQKRWSRVEARAAELLAQIQPNYASEAHRNAIVSYLRCLIINSIPCHQVFTSGSVPLKTYLPDGDIDLTVFTDNQLSEERLIQDLLYILDNERNNEHAEFHVKETQYIQAEVKIIKCLIEKLVVDISFNQIGGLGTLCFLEEVDNLIGKKHLFKKSIILIKAWCFYESRIVGSHHALFSTYGLETLILYLFNVYSNRFAGPLEVLYQFLDFFSKFDWSKYCISLRGPVPISSLPNMKAEPLRYARMNSPGLLLTEKFLCICESKYSVKLNPQEMNDKPFVCKYINIIDPLRANNNLGRSINQGNFRRIKSALSLGAKRIERFLTCPEENIIAEFDSFFKKTWDRNGKGFWIDAVSYNLYRNAVEQAQASHGHHGMFQNPAYDSEESKQMIGTSDVFAANAMNNALVNSGKSPIYSSNEAHGMHHFHGFNSSSEFSHLYSEAPTDHHHNTRFSSEIQQPSGYGDWRSEYAYYPENACGYYAEHGFGVHDENVFHVDEAMMMHQGEFGFPNLNEYQEAPVNVNSSDASFQPPPYMYEDAFGVVPEDFLSFESFSEHNVPYSHDIAPFSPENKDVGNSRASFSSRTNLSSSNSSTGKTYRSGGVSGNLIDQSNIGTDLSENTSTTESITSRVQALQLGREQPMTLPNSSVPADYTPFHVGPPGSSQRGVDNKSSLPVAGGSSGQSFQVVPTMSPFYYLPIAATSYDILDGDFETHYVNLQYGKFFKNPNLHPILPMHLWPQFPLHMRPNVMEDTYFPVCVMPPLRASHLHRDSLGFLLPRLTDGTGTFFPKPSSAKYQPRFFKRRPNQQNRCIQNRRFESKDNNDERDQNLLLNSEEDFPSLGHKFQNPGSNESSHQGESSSSFTSKVSNFGPGRDSESSSTNQPSSSKYP